MMAMYTYGTCIKYNGSKNYKLKNGIITCTYNRSNNSNLCATAPKVWMVYGKEDSTV